MLVQLTRDHTVTAALTEDEARSHESRNLLNRAIVPDGTRGHTDVGQDLATTAVRPGDRLGLTGDGVHVVLEPDKLVTLMVQPGDPDDVGQAIADAVERAAAPDNYALIVVDLTA